MSQLKQVMEFISILVVIFLSLLSETQFTGSIAKTEALSDAQLKELEQLRVNLEQAFENFDEHLYDAAVPGTMVQSTWAHNNHQPSAQLRANLEQVFGNFNEQQFNVAVPGIIVQPIWTHNNQQPMVHRKPKVQVTQKGLEEVKALRSEIGKAVAQNIYVASPNSERHMQHLMNEFGADQAEPNSFFTSKSDDRAGAGHVSASQVGAGHGDVDHKSATADDDKTNGPNIIEASAFDEHEVDISKLQRLELAKRRTKETLILKSVEEDYSFNLGDDVQQWAHILHNGTEYFIGRRDTDLLIVHKDSAKYQPGHLVDVGQPISYLLTYSYWNAAQAHHEGVILVASRDQVLWYRGSNVTGQLALHWTWTVGSNISGLTYLTLENNDYLIVSSDESSRAGYHTLNIYQFELPLREFWIAQRLQLQHACSETAVLDTGRDVILAVPQQNSTAIYAFNPRADETDHLRFKLRQHIASEGIESVAAFQMGGRSYLALGGLQPQILLYEQGVLLPKTMLAGNFGRVQLFLPVPVRTYRDDLILFVQHHVDFGTHGLTVLETLIWDGEAFETSIPVPCQLDTHTAYGVSCMLDMQRDAGLKGAALFRRGDEVSIIVPRDKAESGLFRLHTELLARNSELVDLQEIFNILQNWVREQDELMSEAQVFLQTRDDVALETVPDLSELQTLETPALKFNGDIDELYINDYKWTAEDNRFELTELLKEIKALEMELKRSSKRSRRDINSMEDELNFAQLELARVHVEELLVARVNGERFYVQDGALEFDGIVNAQQLEVLERVNARETRETRETRQTDSVVVANNVEFETINGISWQKLRDNLVFTNEPLNLSELQVVGDIIVENSIHVSLLNSLVFPDDYLLSNGPSMSIVSAEKSFTDTLNANTVDVEGRINGADPLKAITLSGEQYWQGMPTFTHLRVSEVFQLNGTTRGRNLENLPNNPTLKDSHHIEANCNFRQLLVNGPIILGGRYAGQPLAPLLRDVVQRPVDPDAEIVIPSRKSFSRITMPVDFNVLDSKINAIPIEQFVPGHTQQELNLSTLNAYVYFTNLTLGGRYDGVDIAELMQRAIRIDEPQLTPTTQLNFAQPLTVSALNVSGSLNGVPIAGGYQTLAEDINIPAAYFEHLQATVAEIPNDIMGVGVQLNGWNMSQYRGTAQQQQQRGVLRSYATGNIYIEELTLLQGMNADKVRGIDATLMWQFLNDVSDLTEMILDGKIQVDHVIVTGDVQLHKLNQQRFDEDLQLTIVWLNRPNYLSTSLQFAEPLRVRGDLHIAGAYNGQELPALIEDMIFRSGNATKLVLATKRFAGDVRVRGETHVEAINGVPFAHIATKKTLCNFRGSLQIRGILEVHDLELVGAFNANRMSALSNAVRYDRKANAFIIQGAVPLRTPTGAPHYLQDLSIAGNLNDLPNLAGFFDDLVYKHKTCLLKGRNVFTGRVSIEKGAYIRELNGNNLLSLFGNIVYLNEPQSVHVKSPVVFAGPVKAQQVAIQRTLDTSSVCGCSLKQWLKDTLRVDQPQKITTHLAFTPGSLNGNSLYVSYLNEIDLSQLITLNTAQNLTNNLAFSALHLDGQIQTQGLVNNINLTEAYHNTLLTHGNQHVTTPLSLQSATVLRNLQTNAPINNDKDLRNVATLNGDLHFESPLYFSDLSVQNLKTRHIVSGINMDQWFQSSLWSQDKPQQLIIGNWSARSLTVNTGPTLPTYMGYGAPTLPTELDTLTRNVRAEQRHTDVCARLRKLAELQQKRSYVPKYFEDSFTLKSESFMNLADGMKERKISAVYALANEERGHTYLLVNMGCQAHILKWQAQSEVFEKVTSFASGHLQQVLPTSVGKRNATFSFDFVTLSKRTAEADCTTNGLNVWRLQQDRVTLHKSYTQHITDLQLAAGSIDKLYALAVDTVYGYNLTQHARTNNWLLPTSLGKGAYRFVPQRQTDALVLTNGAHILAFNDDTLDEAARNKRNSTERYSLPLYYQRAVHPVQIVHLSESVLQSSADNASKTHTYEFADFRAFIWRLLDDLDYRLRLEVNITQLSIPETDLYDEHLVQDFLDIVEELQEQKFYASQTFADINLRNLRIPNNPARVLAARSVQIIWPVIVEMQEIHGHLHTADKPVHPICANISAELGATIHDVLLLGYTKAKDAKKSNKESAAHAWELAAVIERVHGLQLYLHEMMHELHAHEHSEVLTAETAETMDASATNAHASYAQILRMEDKHAAATLIFSNNSTEWLKLASDNLPALAEGELHALEVGAQQEPLVLLAVTHTQARRNGVHLYMDVLSGSGLFQFIAADEPRALTSLRIGAQTLLAYVEAGSGIRLWIYRGVQGFVEFAHFESPRGEVLQLFTLFLPSMHQQSHYYLGAVHADAVVFYNLVATGARVSMSTMFNICN